MFPLLLLVSSFLFDDNILNSGGKGEEGGGRVGGLGWKNILS